MEELKRTVKWLEKTDGRDKFCKAIQYACRMMMHQCELKGYKTGTEKFGALFIAMRDARKLFRLLKSLNQLNTFLDLLQKADPTLAFQMLSRLGFFLYWLFDNISIIRKLKLLTGDAKSAGKWAATFWLIALFFALIDIVMKIRVLSRKSDRLQGRIFAAANDKESDQLRKEANTLNKESKKQYLSLVKTLGDIFPAGQGSEFWSKFGWNANDTICGLGGLISALISSYQLYD